MTSAHISWISVHQVLGTQNIPTISQIRPAPWHLLCLKWVSLPCPLSLLAISYSSFKAQLKRHCLWEMSPLPQAESNWVLFLCCWVSLSTLLSPLWTELIVGKSHVSVSWSVNKQMIGGHLLRPRHHARHWRNSHEQERCNYSTPGATNRKRQLDE